MNQGIIPVDIGGPLLSREDERRIFQKIERLEKSLFGLLLGTPESRALLLRAAALAKAGEAPEVAREIGGLGIEKIRGRVSARRMDALMEALVQATRDAGALKEWIREACLDQAAACPDRDEMLGLIAELDETKSEVLRRNLRFVLSLSKQHMKFVRSLTLTDLFQEGALGCLKAVDRFDWRRGNKFSTYACWWIRHSLKRAIHDTDRDIRIPVHLQEAMAKVRRHVTRMRAALGRDPGIDEIMDALSFSEAKIRKVMGAESSVTFSIDVPMQGQEGADGATPGNVIPLPDSSQPDGLDTVHDREVRERVRDGLRCLDRKEQKILELRFALDGGDPMTLAEIGVQYGVSRERIRQLEDRALRKMKKHRPGLRELI